MPKATPLLATRSLSKRFGRVQAVKNLDISIHEGDIYGFLGLNGAGKTTTLRMILGLVRPGSGEMELDGVPLSAGSPAGRSKLGALVEGPAFFPRLSGLQNLQLLGGLGGTVTREEAAALMERVGLREAASRPAGTYSLGMKQRLGIALALVGNPRLVVLDEPTNGLDPRGIQDIRRLVVDLNRDQGLTFLLSSHLLGEVEQICSRAGILHQGRLLVEGAVSDLIQEPLPVLRLRLEPVDQAAEVLGRLLGRRGFTHREDGFLVHEADTPGLVADLVAAGLRVHEVSRRARTLEDVFMERVLAEETFPPGASGS